MEEWVDQIELQPFPSPILWQVNPFMLLHSGQAIDWAESTGANLANQQGICKFFFQPQGCLQRWFGHEVCSDNSPFSKEYGFVFNEFSICFFFSGVLSQN